MKNKILVIIAILLIALVIIIRLIFNQKLEEFKIGLANFETVQYEQFNSVKEQRLAEMSNLEPAVFKLFVDSLEVKRSVIERDTTFSFLYLKKRVSYKTHSISYLDCLYDKISIETRNAKTIRLINSKEVEFQKKFKDAFSLWYPQFKDEKLIPKDSVSMKCSTFYPELSEIRFDASLWEEFSKFLREYTQQVRLAETQKKSTVSQYENARWSAQNRLKSRYRKEFEDKMIANRNEILNEKDVTQTFTSPKLGTINYSVKNTSMDWEKFNNIVDETFLEQWKNNSLPTGSMPYAYCFGSGNYCGGYSCSEIQVRAGGTDVLVTIKNAGERVVRHGYIQANSDMSFYVPDGSYQVFFYSGKGWNPDKFIANTNYGKLVGGFVMNESYSKGSYEDLSSAILSYELISQVNGNFSPSSSSANEAFN